MKLCVSSGLVGGSIQSIDSAYINANASLDRMTEIKLIDRDPKDYLEEVLDQDLPEDVTIEDQINRVAKAQKYLTSFTEMRRKKYTDQDGGKKHRKTE